MCPHFGQPCQKQPPGFLERKNQACQLCSERELSILLFVLSPKPSRIELRCYEYLSHGSRPLFSNVQGKHFQISPPAIPCAISFPCLNAFIKEGGHCCGEPKKLAFCEDLSNPGWKALARENKSRKALGKLCNFMVYAIL